MGVFWFVAMGLLFIIRVRQ